MRWSVQNHKTVHYANFTEIADIHTTRLIPGSFEMCPRLAGRAPGLPYPEGGRLLGGGGFFIPRRNNSPVSFLFQFTEIRWLAG